MSFEARGSLGIAYFAHTIRSDWNNGNAHFLRGLLRALTAMGHTVTAFEPELEWSIENLREEPLGLASLDQFTHVYPEIAIETYTDDWSRAQWLERLSGVDVVILHEWNPPALAAHLLALREELRFRLLFHDTHHRASSSPQQLERFQLRRFDGILAFGESLRSIYRERFDLERVWTLHEAADTSVFQPLLSPEKTTELVWIGNWGEDERAAEIRHFYLDPALQLSKQARFTLYGVRYPADALAALQAAHVAYRGYLPNLQAPAVYSAANLTVHIPRQQYSSAMRGIPTIRVFEALACGIPLISAPWDDCEALFAPGDFLMVENGGDMEAAMLTLLHDRALAEAQAARGLATVRARHTCAHRAEELTAICWEVCG